VPTADGGVEPIEMDAVHWTMRGQAMYAYFSAKDITGKDRHCDFRFMAQFARTPYAPDREVAQNLSEESICRDGDSYYSLDGEPPVLEIAQLQVSVHFLKNAKGRIAGAVSDILSDTTQKNAIAASESVFNSIALDWTARANLPLFIDAVQVDSVDDKQKFTKIVIPFPDALNFDVLPKLPANVPGMLPFVALFSEGIRAASPFYRFLCFFKIVEKGLGGIVGGKLAKLARKFNVTLPPLSATIPADLENGSPGYTGKKFTVVRDALRDEYRNVIAHLDVRDAVIPFSPAAEIRVTEAARVMAYMARHIIEKMYDALIALRSAGCDVSDVHFD
jgi:hypothetical protein